MTLHGAALLGAVAEHTQVTVLAGVTGDAKADADVLMSVQHLAPGRPPPPVGSVAEVVSTARTRVVTTSDADEEVRHAVRTVLNAARDGVPFGRMAILHASPQPYARLIHEQLETAGIDRNGASVTSLAERTTGRVLLRLFEWPLGGYQRWELFTWLSASPVRDGTQAVPVSGWERLSREAAVVSGRADWDRQLDWLAHELDEKARQLDADPEQPASRAARSRTDAGRARDLRRFALDLIDELDTAAAGPRSWADHAAWARALLERLLGRDGPRQAWAREEQPAERVEAALDRLAAIGQVEGPVGLDVFARTLRLVLDADLGRVGRLGEGVLVGPVSMGVGLDLDVVVVLGLAEGTFPGPIPEDALLSDAERSASGDGAAFPAGASR